MAKDDTIENRVYLFDSLASSYVSAASDLLSSEDEAVRARAMRALADLAFVSCVVADTGHLARAGAPARAGRSRAGAVRA